MISVDVASIGKNYGRLRVLDAITTTFAAGALTSLLGPSGSGKTTLLRIIGGFIAADEGQIRFSGEDVTEVPLWQRNIGMVFQSYALFPHMSVLDNVLFGLHRRGVRGAEALRRAGEALDMVHLDGFETRRPKQLSGGQQQRVALARAIVTRPRVLLLDEPLSALDRRLRQEMQVELRRIQRDSGLTTIFVTHDQEEALTLSDAVAILDKGRIVQEGAPGEIYERPRTRFAAAFLGDANFLSGQVQGGAVMFAGRPLRTSMGLPAEGQMATLAVRPEKLRFLPPGAEGGGENSIEARIGETIYAGSVSTFLLEATDGSKLKVLAQNRDIARHEIGEVVTLAWSPAHTVPVAD